MSSKAIALPGQETLVASWNALARTSPGARLVHSAAATAAVFPSWVPLNNAILLSGHAGDEAAVATELTSVYAEAGVRRVGVVGAERRDRPARPGRCCRVGGLRRDTTTLVMRARLRPGLQLHDGVVPRVDRGGHPRRRRTGSRHRSRGAGHGTGPGGVGAGAATRRRWPAPGVSGTSGTAGSTRSGPCRTGGVAAWREAWWNTCWPMHIAGERGPRPCNRHEPRSSCTSRLALNRPGATRNGCPMTGG